MSEIKQLQKEIEELRNVVKNRLPDPAITIGYMEHFLDLTAKVVEDLSSVVDQTQLTTDQQDRLAKMQDFLQSSSVDFSKAIDDPAEAWKYSKGIKLKQDVRYLQGRYIPKKQELESKLNS